ncbi:PH domain-containing protein [Halosolutus gelatinilyticus]|uniref:PH domain-containing protein n=1 Tax=Halosolutus gelatinilyticus TaxID=2931975 RepID=UPI001FF5644C|nr:PH domain-containing protein [Halosolutus gelatinilyticus]
MGLFGSNSDEQIPTEYKCSPQGDYVTAARLGKIEDILDEGESVHYITRGGTIDVEGSSAGTSLFGDDRSRKSGTKGYVRAAITDQRIAIKIPQWLGSDERSVPYRNITSVDLDTGLVNKRLSLQTPGQTYHIQVTEPGKDETREIVRFIREKMEETSQPETVVAESEPDPLDQLEKLKELHDKGVVSDEEFKEKKQALLDQI